jgi:hypothetical protein
MYIHFEFSIYFTNRFNYFSHFNHFNYSKLQLFIIQQTAAALTTGTSSPSASTTNECFEKRRFIGHTGNFTP